MSSSITKGRLLTFEISGEGNLPHVTVSRPKILNKKRNPLLVFKRTLLGKSSKMKISLKNEGIFDCQVPNIHQVCPSTSTFIRSI